MKFTIEDLRSNSRAYDRNFTLICNLRRYGTPKHKLLLCVEHRINQRGIRIRKALGIGVESPCPLERLQSCQDCHGWLKMMRIEHSKTRKFRTRIVSAHTPGSWKCPQKDI